MLGVSGSLRLGNFKITKAVRTPRKFRNHMPIVRSNTGILFCLILLNTPLFRSHHKGVFGETRIGMCYSSTFIITQVLRDYSLTSFRVLAHK